MSYPVRLEVYHLNIVDQRPVSYSTNIIVLNIEALDL